MKRLWTYLTAATVAAMAVTVGTVASARADGFSPPQPCTKSGHLSYTLNRAANPTADQSSAYSAIDAAMQQAISFDNCYLDVTEAMTVVYDPNEPTARGNQGDRLVTFGAGRQYMAQATAMHEIAHTLGVGLDAQWAPHVVNGVWTGTAAITALQSITGDTAAVVHADKDHFWPYGLNQESEVHSADDLLNHCLMLAAIRHDMGLGA